jgi:Putative Ig domain
MPVVVGVPFSITCQISGGTGPYTIASVSLPPGFGVSLQWNSLTISGTFAQPGVYTMAVGVTSGSQALLMEWTVVVFGG